VDCRQECASRSSPATGAAQLTPNDSINWTRCDELLRRDPARRGIAAFVHQGTPLAAGHFERAARSLAESAKGVAIVTGFAVETDDGIRPETDGPPGALYLARALSELGIPVTLVTDAIAREALAVGCRRAGLPQTLIQLAPPYEPSAGVPSGVETGRIWAEQFFASEHGRQMTHLIAIERVGPNHSTSSVVENLALEGEVSDGDSLLALFANEVPAVAQNHCYNMRGESISHCTGAAHELFDHVASRRLHVTTIGIGDGGNEIGMGALPWQVVRQAIAFGPAGKVACRVPTNHLIVAGVSNWGGYALALAVARLRGRPDAVAWGDVDYERRMLQTLVDEGGAVDGVTGRREATVDGLPLETYLAILSGLRETFGLM